MRVDSARTSVSTNSRFVFSTEAANGPDVPPESASSLTVLTADDRALIKAATGYEVSSSGVVTNAAIDEVEPFISTLASDRAAGRLRGEITLPYLNGLVARSNANPDYLSGAVEYLKPRGREKRVDLAL